MKLNGHYTKDMNAFQGKKFPPVVYGLDGIMQVFNVSRTTACIYRKTFLAPACASKGKTIIVDVAKALSLFGFEDPSALIEYSEKPSAGKRGRKARNANQEKD